MNKFSVKFNDLAGKVYKNSELEQKYTALLQKELTGFEKIQHNLILKPVAAKQALSFLFRIKIDEGFRNSIKKANVDNTLGMYKDANGDSYYSAETLKFMSDLENKNSALSQKLDDLSYDTLITCADYSRIRSRLNPTY